MKRLRAVVFVFSALLPALFGMAGASAQNSGQSEALAAAKELMTVISKDTVQQMATAMADQVWPSIEQTLRKKQPDIDKGTLAGLRSEFERIQLEYLASVMSEAPAIYARHFTAQELRDMLAFYRTPTGVKTLQVLPQVMTEVFGQIMPKVQALQVQIMEAFAKLLRQRGFDI